MAGGFAGVLLVLLPKCPACLAAYLAISVTGAVWLRTGLLGLFVASVAVLLTSWIRTHAKRSAAV